MNMHEIAVSMTKLLPPHIAAEWLDKIRRANSPDSMNEICLPIPLIGGGVAELVIPRTVSVSNFGYLKCAISNILDGIEEAIVS